MPTPNIPAIIDHKYLSPEARVISLMLATYSHSPRMVKAARSILGPNITNTIWPFYSVDELAQHTSMDEGLVSMGLEDLDRDPRLVWALIPHTPIHDGAVITNAYETGARELREEDKRELAQALEAAKREVAASRRLAVAA
ncbi:hypothetical protein [Citricoccus nitrophenolicus]|uniref:hypothetical protein n=1 Tax=Citricoccus nitrophenolicus TaxID=863575 RepID=UPI0031F08469